MNNKRKKLGRRLITFILAVCAVLSLCALVSCQREPSPEEREQILTEFKALYQSSLELNEYIFGKGLPLSEEPDPDSTVSPLYISVSENSPYKTELEFTSAILSVYSNEYFEDSLKSLLFEGYENEKKLTPRYKESSGVLQFDVTSSTGFDTSGRFDVSTAEIVKLTAGFCQIECDYVRGSVSGRFTLTLAKTSAGWRFDAPTI